VGVCGGLAMNSFRENGYPPNGGEVKCLFILDELDHLGEAITEILVREM
jgi:hypothetical protein